MEENELIATVVHSMTDPHIQEEADKDSSEDISDFIDRFESEERSLSSKDEAWVVPLLILSSISVTMILVYQVVVVCKVINSSLSRRHLFLSQALSKQSRVKPLKTTTEKPPTSSF